MILTIKKGKHFSNELFGFLFGWKWLAFHFDFSEAKYLLSDKHDQTAWNKLFGVSGCFFPRLRYWSEQQSKYASFRFKVANKYLALFMPWHWNSARWVWRYSNFIDLFQVTPYYYKNGVRLYDKEIRTIGNSHICNLFIKKTKSDYTFGGAGLYNDIKIESKNSFVGHKLTLFFGGKKPAPKDVKVIKQKI